MAMLAVVLCLVLVGMMVGASLPHDNEGQLQRKAKKFDDYCAFVRVSLESVESNLRDHADPKFRARLAQLFYSDAPHLDRMYRDAVWRCAAEPIDPPAVRVIYDRCRPPGTCVLEAEGAPRCQVDPACLAPAIGELVRLIAPSG